MQNKLSYKKTIDRAKNKTFVFCCLLIQDRAHKDEKDFRRQANIQELVTLKESEKHLQQELERTKELLRLEQHNHRGTLEKVFETCLLKINEPFKV